MVMVKRRGVPMKFRSLIKSKILKNITDRTEITDERILFYLSEFIEGRYTPSKTEPSVCFNIEGDTVMAYMNYELIDKFDLNTVICTREVAHLVESNQLTDIDITELLSRHTANMSDCSKNTKRINEMDIKIYGRVVSIFNFKDFEIKVQTYLFDKNNDNSEYINHFNTCISLV